MQATSDLPTPTLIEHLIRDALADELQRLIEELTVRLRCDDYFPALSTLGAVSARASELADFCTQQLNQRLAVAAEVDHAPGGLYL